MFKKNFFNKAVTSIETSEGPVEIPSFYYDGSSVAAFFMCPYDRVAPKLNGTGLVPVRVSNNRVPVVLSFFDYRDSCFGAYKEVILMTAVSPEPGLSAGTAGFQLLKRAKKRMLGFYIFDLPITKALPLAAGVEVWGLPKYYADINTGYPRGRFEGKVLDRETKEDLVTLECSYDRGFKMPFQDNVFYSHLNDRLIKIIINMNASGKFTSGNKSELRIGTADHQMVRNMTDLGLDITGPAFIQTCTRLQFRINMGLEIKEWEPL